MSFRTIFAVLMALALQTVEVGAKELRYALFVGPRSIENRALEGFFKDRAGATKNDLTGKIFAGGQLLGPAATLRGIRDGVADVGFIVPGFTQAELKHVNIMPDLVAYTLDAYAAAAAGTEWVMLHCEECRKDYAAQKSIFLGGHASTPWNLMCAKPLNSVEELKGKKVRTIGVSATRMVRALGMVAVTMSPNELSSALSGGQIDCAVGPAAWLADYGLWDVVKQVIDIDLGISSGLGLFVVNEASFRGMDAAGRKAFLDLIPVAIATATQGYVDQTVDVRNQAQGKGVTFVKPGADIVAAIDGFRKSDLPNIAADIKARGVGDAEKYIQSYLDTLKRWETDFNAKGRKPDVAAALMRDNIFSKAKLP
jgi:TRAP-type transport system periplasmic protein